MTEVGKEDWPEGWEPVVDEAGALFVAQLLSETGPVEGVRADTLKCVGRLGGSDDMVFAAEGWEAPFFVAHLSWSKPDKRSWIMRKLQPWRQLAPSLTPVRAIGELARYFDDGVS